MKLKRNDIIATLLFIAAWGYYFLFPGKTGLDITDTFTFPLLIAAEATAIFLIYAIWRYLAAKKGQGMREMVVESIKATQKADVKDKQSKSEK